MLQVFGADCLRDGSLKVSSTKGACGHLLGAAGAVEAAFTVMTAHERRIPATKNLKQADDESMVGLVTAEQGPVQLAKSKACMCNSFGFGGVNTALVVTPVEGPLSWSHYI